MAITIIYVMVWYVHAFSIHMYEKLASLHWDYRKQSIPCHGIQGAAKNANEGIRTLAN